MECGNHYARALASWSLLLALSGFRYSAPEKTMGFHPKSQAGRFVSFWSVGEPGYGLYEQERSGSYFTASLTLVHGSGIDLERLSLPATSAGSVEVTAGPRRIPASLEASEGKTLIAFREPVALTAGSEVRVSIREG